MSPELSVDDEFAHTGTTAEEWSFAAWSADGSCGVISTQRLLGRRCWYWSAVVQAGMPLVTLAEFEAVVRPDPFIVKAHGLWAEHICDAPLEQWTIGNEAIAVALEDPAAALGRAYGEPTAMAMDLEWYATAPPVSLAAPDANDDEAHGFVQDGTVHGVVEVAGRARAEWVEVPARRWRRWTRHPQARLEPLPLSPVRAHRDLFAPFSFPDATTLEMVLTPDGWRRRVA